jgi:hypothetical protein
MAANIPSRRDLSEKAGRSMGRRRFVAQEIRNYTVQVVVSALTPDDQISCLIDLMKRNLFFEKLLKLL